MRLSATTSCHRGRSIRLEARAIPAYTFAGTSGAVFLPDDGIVSTGN